MSLHSLSSLSGLDFVGYFRRALHNRTLSPDVIVNVAQPSHLKQLGALMHATPLSTLQDYAEWMTLNAYASDLTRALSRAHWEFFGRTLAGTVAQAKRHQVCQSMAVSLMAD